MPKATRKFDPSKYIGIRGHCPDPRTAAVLFENSTISQTFYRAGTVDHAIFDQAIVLNEETADYVYSEFTPLDQPFARGSRPFLEKIVDQVLAGKTTERDKAIALLDWCTYIPTIYSRSGGGGFGEGSGEPFHGGAEEEVIRKGSSMCNEVARVLAVLAQIAGMPSRYVGHMLLIDYDDPRSGTGHGINEIYVDGAWAYFDIRGRYFIKDDGAIASAWDLLQDPGLTARQSDEVVSHRYSRMDHTNFRRFYEPPSVTIVANYLAADHAKYDYSWVYPSASLALEARESGRKIRITRHRDLLPQPRLRVV
jgi:hypothetical protein